MLPEIERQPPSVSPTVFFSNKEYRLKEIFIIVGLHIEVSNLKINCSYLLKSWSLTKENSQDVTS